MKTYQTSGLWKIDAIGVGLLVTLAGVVWFAGVRPVAAARDHVAAEEAAYTAAYRNALDTAADAARCREQLAVAERQRNEKSISIEPAERLNHRLAMLNDLASKSDVRLDELQPNKPVPGNRYNLLPIHVAGTGSFQCAVAFLHRLHTACPDIGVGVVKVQGQPASTTKPAKFSVDLTWYTQATPEQKAEAK